MELMKRVAALLKERQISQAAFARKIEASPQTLSGWMTGRNQPSVASVAKMCEVLGVSPSWLITGQDDAVHAQSLVDEGFVMIPLLDIEASCGNGMFIERSSVVRLIQVNRPWIQRYCGQVNERSLNIIGVYGDSMAPTLADGDFVVIDRSATHIYTDSMFAFTIAGDLFIKRFQRQGRNLRVISDNNRYEAYTLTPESLDSSFRVLGRVVTTCVVRAV